MRRAVALALAATTGCASTRTELDGAGLAEPPPRRPAAVALEMTTELPRAVPSADSRDGIAILAEPLDPRPALRIVEGFFAAIVRESADDLEQYLDGSAHSRLNARARPDAALPWWRRRFERLDYTALGAEVLYRPSEVELHTGRDAALLSDTRPLPVVPKEDEVLARVPIVTTRQSPLFADEVFLLLRPGPAGYKIGEIYEDFRLP